MMGARRPPPLVAQLTVDRLSIAAFAARHVPHRYKCCVPGTVANCTSCSLYDSALGMYVGACVGTSVGCGPGTVVSATGTCVTPRAAGATCDTHRECSSGVCGGGRCCAARTSSACTVCAAGTGVCTACGFDRMNTPTVLGPSGGCVKLPGGPCFAGTECTSGVCAGYVCCAQGMGPNCTACTVDGRCSGGR
jgi:hypothetical protein